LAQGGAKPCQRVKMATAGGSPSRLAYVATVLGAILVLVQLFEYTTFWSKGQSDLGDSRHVKSILASSQELKDAVQSIEARVLELQGSMGSLRRDVVTKDEMTTYMKEMHNRVKEKRSPALRKAQVTEGLVAPVSHADKTPISKQATAQLDNGRVAEDPGPDGGRRRRLETLNEKCTLPRLAKIASFERANAACIWTPVKRGNEPFCEFTLAGQCDEVYHAASGCTFAGYPRNEQYQPGDFILPERVPGEIDLTSEEEAMLRKPFEACESRSRYFMVSEQLLHIKGGKVIDKDSKAMGTDKNPLLLMAGGSENIAQHFYFVVGEVGRADSYRLGWQDPRKMKVVVDIGANVGLFSISVCLRFPNARILAFEPHPANFRYLKHNLKAAGCDGQVEAFNKGVSSDGRGMKIYWHDSIGTSAFRVGPNYIRMETVAPSFIFDLLGSDDVSLLKIDCEGCEYEVLPQIPMPRLQQLFCEVHKGWGSPQDRGNTGGDAVVDVKKLMDDVQQTCEKGNPWGIWVPA